MGYIAPNVWLKNEYGEGLRRKLKASGQLDRWIDFKSFQVFEDVTVYTSLQFYSAARNDQIRFHHATDGEIGEVDWERPKGSIMINDLSSTDAWSLLYESDERLFKKFDQQCTTLGEFDCAIVVGVQTSADWCFHLDRTEQGNFVQTKPRPGPLPPDGVEYEIESAIVKPLISGSEAKRYLRPTTNTFVIFPYDLSGSRPRLYTIPEMERTFPKAWAYLRKYETELRERESSAFDDDEWYRFGRNQNIDKQDSLKLGVAQTVPSLRVFADCDGEFCFNNVRVNGIIPQDADDLFLLLGILNSPTANWCFTRIAKPKDNGYYESNKQFIAPLPIPKATSDCSEVAKLAETLQEKHTSRRKRIDKLQKRIDSPGCIEFSFKEDWLWADVKTAAQLKHEAPDAITSARERTAWAKAERQRRLDIHHEKVNAMLYAGMRLEATHDEDAVHVRSEHQTLLSKYGLDRDEAELIAVLWSQILRSTNVTAKFTSEALVKKLLKFRSTEDEGLRNTIIKINGDITELDAEIADTEDKLNQLTYKLYDLTPEEIALVESANL